jgi:Ca-activated chloride channel homolog
MRLKLFTLLAAALALLSAATPSQTPAPRQQTAPPRQSTPPRDAAPGGETLSIDTNEVLLPVTVRDGAGQFVPNLKAADFTVYEDGRPQPITSFALKRLPVNVVLLIDTSSSVTRELDDFKAAALRFAAALEPDDRLSLIKFDDKVELVLDWTTSRAALSRALNRLTTGMFTKFNDALFLAAREQLKEVTGRKAVIVLTDGVDSNRGYTSPEGALRALIEAETPVYAVSKTLIQRRADEREAAYYRSSNSAYNKLKLDGLRLSLAALDASEKRLARLAEETGGRMFLPESFDELGDVYQQVADELRSQYVIFYTPENPARDGSYRAVRVRVNRPQHHVTSRLGYYAR